MNNNKKIFISLLLNDILLTRRVIEMEPLKNLKNVDNKTIIRPQSIEEKLEEAEKDYEEGRVHSEDEVWTMLSKKYGFDL